MQPDELAAELFERKQAEEKYRTLFESIDEGFCTIEVLFDGNDKPVDYRFLEISPSFEKHNGRVYRLEPKLALHLRERSAQLLGLPRDQLIGQSVWDLFPEAVGSETYRKCQQAMTERVPSTSRRSSPTRGTRTTSIPRRRAYRSTGAISRTRLA